MTSGEPQGSNRVRKSGNEAKISKAWETRTTKGERIEAGKKQERCEKESYYANMTKIK